MLLKDFLPLLKGQRVKTDQIIFSTKSTPAAQGYLQRGQIDEDVPVQSARSHQSIVQDVCSVGGGEDDDVVRRAHSCRRARGGFASGWNRGAQARGRVRLKLTIHLHQQLVERLLLLGVGEPRHVGGALLSHGVDLVDVDDAGRSAPSLFEQAPDPSGTQT